MRIGELARRSGTTPRLLRYYEEQELLSACRTANGYREYGEHQVDRVHQIRGLLDAGLPTRIIREILPCLHSPSQIAFPEATPETIQLIEEERERIAARLAVLERNHAALGNYLDALAASHAPQSLAQGLSA